MGVLESLAALQAALPGEPSKGRSILLRVLLTLEVRLRKEKISALEFRNCFLFIQQQLVRAQSVDLDRDKMIAKGRAIKNAIKAGEAVITAHKNVLGGGEFKEDKKKPAVELSDSERLQLRAKWKDGKAGTLPARIKFDRSKQYPASPYAMLESDPLPFTAEQPSCSFCHKPVSFQTATSAKRSSITVVPELVGLEDDNPRIENRIISRNTEILACSDCCLKIKPKKDGSSGLRWVSREEV